VRPRAILFDVDGTLVDRRGAFRRWALKLMARHPRKFPVPRRADDLAFLETLDGHGLRDPAAFVADVATAYGLDAGELGERLHDELAECIEPDLEVADMLAALSEEFVLAVVDNGSADIAREKLLRAGLAGHLAMIFLSGELGVEKPSPLIFEQALDTIGCPPEEALHVGDDPELDVAAAHAAGVATCWLRHGRLWPPGLARPRLVIDRLIELPRLLESD
jgi:putative hydrolase of the HAD superfamily